MLAALLVQGCDKAAPPAATVLEAQPGGPYRMTLALDPRQPKAGAETRLTWHLSHTASGAPLENLQVLHERVVHNFIVNLDFTSFAHIHHEDFRAVTADDLKHASLSLPYRFPSAGHYRVVSEFTHRKRSWIKHFDVVVGTPATRAAPPADLTRTRVVAGITAQLTMSPPLALAGVETELVLTLSRAGQPVTDLALVLGSEIHVALWREDGQHFGHTHSYTPHMATMLGALPDPNKDPARRGQMLADMMVMMMNMPSELVFHGPQIPAHYVFPAPGIYHLFFQCAPGGTPQVFHFALAVQAYRDGMQTRIASIVSNDSAGP